MRKGGTHVRGQGLVEFALVVPLFLVLLFGMVEFGRAWMTKNILTGAGREAVRLAVVQVNFETSESAAVARAQQVLNSAGIYGASVSVTPYETPEPGIEVTVAYVFPILITNFIPGWGSPLTLASTTSMRRERY
jgi:Flp pilus assembly protein TadG